MNSYEYNLMTLEDNGYIELNFFPTEHCKAVQTII